METIAAGYEFAHRDDYEGRDVLPSIKVDADSRNIEELTSSPIPSASARARLARGEGGAQAAGFTFKDYDGMMAR
jgi:nitrogenase molybdenum-iron protein alpha chain